MSAVTPTAQVDELAESDGGVVEQRFVLVVAEGELSGGNFQLPRQERWCQRPESGPIAPDGMAVDQEHRHPPRAPPMRPLHQDQI